NICEGDNPPLKFESEEEKMSNQELEKVIGNKGLTDAEKTMMLTLQNKMKGKEYINISNQEIAEMFGISINSASVRINNLRRKGYIKVEVIRVGVPVAERRIYLIEKDE